jgi:HAD superfamily hydrolase (TIGR01509 family)
MSKYRGLILDMDGLMIDSERLYFEAEREIARLFGKEVRDETLWKMMGRNPAESIRVFVEDLDLSPGVEEILRLRNRIMRGKLKSDLVPMPGLMDLIQIFSRQLKLAVCTGAQKEFLDIVVDGLKIRESFQVLQASDDIKKGKPDPEIYLKTCQKLKLNPEESIVLEDSSNGAFSAKRAGCTVIAVPSEYTKKQDFQCADFIVSDLFGAIETIHILIPS